MIILICEELLDDIKFNIDKIERNLKVLNDENCEAYFIYSFALFESALSQAMRHFMQAIPNIINNNKNSSLSMKHISGNLYASHKMIEQSVDNVIEKINKGSAKIILDKALEVFSIELYYESIS